MEIGVQVSSKRLLSLGSSPRRLTRWPLPCHSPPPKFCQFSALNGYTIPTFTPSLARVALSISHLLVMEVFYKKYGVQAAFALGITAAVTLVVAMLVLFVLFARRQGSLLFARVRPRPPDHYPYTLVLCRVDLVLLSPLQTPVPVIDATSLVRTRSPQIVGAYASLATGIGFIPIFRNLEVVAGNSATPVKAAASGVALVLFVPFSLYCGQNAFPSQYHEAVPRPC